VPLRWTACRARGTSTARSTPQTSPATALPASITRTRTELADTLAVHDLAPGRRDDILLVTTEAATNAVLHAYPDTDPGPLYVAAALVDQDLIVSVVDRGRGMLHRVQRLPLQPGDRLLFLTDGMLERNAASLDINALIVACAEAHPREAVQHLMAAVLDATDGQLRDDATALCLDWHGGPERERTSHAGANA
jgi:anti-sigma regulatory factor (Ser/Thr protein kinase)